MDDKSQLPIEPYFLVPGLSVVTLDGRDAVAFAQAQFMNDVSALQNGHWHWSGWLTPKGRTIALFALLRLSDEALFLVLLDADANAFVSQLQRFVFRSKVKLQVRVDLHASGRMSAPDTAQDNRFSGGDRELYELDLGSTDQPRTLRLSSITAPADPGGAATWVGEDLKHGLPRLSVGHTEQWTPQQLSLDRLKAYSVKKGCYPGQEIVARTHFLGQAKRGLVRLLANAPLQTGEVFEAAGNESAAAPRVIGQLICASGHEGLAVMPLDAGDGPFRVGEQRCTPLRLVDGLAR